MALLNCRIYKNAFRLAGIEAKRLWRHNGTYFTSDGNKDIGDEGGTLNVYNADAERDAGTYECIAVAHGVGQDAIKFNGAEHFQGVPSGLRPGLG